MEIPKIGTGFKALMVAGVLQDEGAMGAATAVLAAGIGKKIFGGLFKKKQEDTLERKFEKVLDERKRLFEKNLPESSILGKTKLIIKKIKEGLSKFLTAVLAALKTIFTIIKTALITVAKALLALVKWIGKKLLRGLLKSLMKLCKSGGFRKMKARIKVFGRKLKRFIKSPAALLIGGIALGMAGYFSAIFKKEKEEIDEIGGEDDEKDTSVSEEAPAKTEEPPTQAAPPAVAPEAAPPEAAIPGQVRVESGGGLTTSEGTPVMTGEPVPAAPAAPPRAAGTPVPAAPAAPPRAAGTPVPAPPAARGGAAGTPVPAPPAAPPRAAGTPVPDSAVKDKSAPMATGGISDSKAIELATSKLGISKEEWNIYKNTIAAIESEGARGGGLGGYGAIGGKNEFYDGRYQMGGDAKDDGAVRAGIENPGHSGDPKNPKRIKFREDPALQEILFAGYTIANHGYLLNKSPDYRKQSKSRQMQVLGYAHNQGHAGAAHWLKTGIVGADGFGTVGTKYTDALRINFTAAGFTGSSSSEKIQTASAPAPAPAPASGNVLASAGPTQYDKDKNTRTNIVIALKANNKTNNIEESRKAA
jgi:hypothetical protein